MMRLSQIAAALDAQLIGADVTFNSVNTDSRKIVAGDLFIALRGENFDGAEYVASALHSGALAAMVNEQSYAALRADLPANAALLLVADTRIALGKLAAFWRAQCEIKLVAITGSNGKTTVKEMLAAILREHAGDAVLATQGNFNNDIGMPLTLLKLTAQHRYAVIEMGMNHAGEIDYLTRLAMPDVALVNNAAGAHLQGLGTIENVARAKGEIFAGLKNTGVAIINGDDAHAAVWRDLAAEHRCVDFSLEHTASVQGQWAAQGFGGVLHALTPAGELHVLLQVPGAHNARNALAAASAAIALEIPLATITRALQNFGGVAGRLQRKQGLAGATLIDDTYNANPASMRAALDVLAAASGQRIFVLGDMGELGDDAAQFHREIGRTAHELGIAKLFALGELSQGAVAEFGAGAEHFATLENLCAAVANVLDKSTTVLVKGSRFMQMERVVKNLADD
ncbi:MAG: UDP-N-acetylmuramoyl-tripeptide--D-alanyl-D-alanine ligase [Sideroxydans sp.]|nr:UDP-N-acetylmuramoyl-tripeptide--D-alanyl-D-alanine ligase [Sideroxydans sp.]